MLRALVEAIGKAQGWLAEAAVPGGCLDRHGLTYRGLFKAPLGLVSAGLPAEGMRALEMLTERFMPPNGDFRDPPGAEPDPHPAPSLEYFYPYRASWIVIGAHRLGRYDVSRRTGEFLLSLQDRNRGGFLTHPQASPPRFHICGTAQAALAALAVGDWQAAERAADFLVRAYDVQGNGAKRFCFTIDAAGRPVRDWPPAETGYCRLDVGRPGQKSFVTGLTAGTLALMHRTTGKERYLERAIRYHDLTRRSHDDAFTNPACGKLAWSSALLYVMTGEQRYRVDGLRAAETLCEIIRRDPPMHLAEDYPDFADQPVPLTFEVAFEYVYWLTETVKELTLSEHTRRRRPQSESCP